MAPARDRDRTELLLGGPELEHVPAHDGGEVHGLREPPERNFEVLLERLGGVHLARTAGHRTALGRPRDREDVEHVTRLARSNRARREIRSSRRPRHSPTPRRGPDVVRHAEMLAEHVDVEIGERTRPRDTVDVTRLETRIGDGPLGGLDPDIARRSPRRLRVRGLTDADDRDLTAHVVEVGPVSPIAHEA